MFPPTHCPYCGDERFEAKAVAVPVDNEDKTDYFNRCLGCAKWSKYVDATGEQLAIDAPEVRPGSD